MGVGGLGLEVRDVRPKASGRMMMASSGKGSLGMPPIVGELQIWCGAHLSSTLPLNIF